MTDRKESKIPYVSLHNHSGYSLFDGFGNPTDHLDFAYSNGLDAHVFTEHGHMNSLSEAFIHNKKMNKEGRNFKQIYGIESYFIDSLEDWRQLKEDKNKEKEKETKSDEDESSYENEEETKSDKKRDPLKIRSHLVILAKNEVGLKNLFKLTSQSHIGDNYYYYPRIDFENLKNNSEGLIVNSACLGGIFGMQFFIHKHLGDNVVYQKQLELAEKFKSIFGNNFNLELQWNAIPEQHILNQNLIRISKELGINLISTCDAHYPNPESWLDREIYKKLKFLNDKNLDNTLPSSLEEMKYELYPKNGDQMWSAYKKYSKELNIEYNDDMIRESLERTHQIAFKEIENYKINTEPKLPSFALEEGEDAAEKLKTLVFDELKVRGLDKDDRYTKQVEYELSVINKRDFAKYFLTTKKITDFTKNYSLPANGRGSVSGSTVAYLLSITQIDPIKWDTSFERFLRPGDDGYPDIDMDHSSKFKEQSLKLFKEQWGDMSVIPISNFSTFKIKSLIKDISKFYKVPFEEVNSLTTSMMNEVIPKAKAKLGITAGVYEPTYDDVKEYSTEYNKFILKYPEIDQHIKSLLGENRQISSHAAGLLLLENLNEKLPLIRVKGELQTPFAEGSAIRALEPLGFLKFDILAITTLDIIENCISNILLRQTGNIPSFEEIKEWYMSKLHPDKIDYDIKKVYENIWDNKKFLSIFQFQESGIQEYSVKYLPRSLNDINIISSVYRPGPLSSNIHHKLLEAKENPQDVKYRHPILKQVLGKTFGLALFQEDIPKVLVGLGKNINLDEGNLFRKILIKKGLSKGKEDIQPIIEKYYEGCKEKGLDLTIAKNILNELEEFGKYSFSENHSLSYSMISYTCAYLFTFFPVEWACAVLEFDAADGADAIKKAKTISLVKSFGFDIIFPDINKSGEKWKIIDDKTIAAPFTLIKGVGLKSVPEILKGQPYSKIEDFLFHDDIIYGKCNKTVINVLCRAGALKDLQDSRFDNDKHFNHCIGEMRSSKETKTAKKLEDYILQTKGMFQPVSKDELLLDKQQLLGFYDVDSIITPQKKKVFEKHGYLPISTFPEYQINEVWFILVDWEYKISKKGNPYYLLSVIDDSYKTNQIYAYDIKNSDWLVKNSCYYGKITKYNEAFGFSLYNAEKVMLRMQG